MKFLIFKFGAILAACPRGYEERNGICEDIDECGED